MIDEFPLAERLEDLAQFRLEYDDKRDNRDAQSLIDDVDQSVHLQEVDERQSGGNHHDPAKQGPCMGTLDPVQEPVDQPGQNQDLKNINQGQRHVRQIQPCEIGVHPCDKGIDPGNHPRLPPL